MNIQQIKFEWIDIPVHKFLDDQRMFLTDASIVCRGFHNILNHDNSFWENFLNKLDTLYNIIYNRYLLVLTLCDAVVWKQEIQIWMWKLLEDITIMKKYCIQERA